MISIEQAIQLVEKHTPVLNTESVSLLDATGRILEQDVFADIMQPPFDRSPLDGYAVRAADTYGASPDQPIALRVVDKLFAGDMSCISIEAGQAVRLMTGSMIPVSADCVIRQEDTDRGEKTVQIYQTMQPNSNYCHCGEEYGIGDKLLSSGQRLDAAAIAVAASAGVMKLSVRRPIKAVIFSTGDEVCQPGQPLPMGKVYDSNTSYLAARLRQLGVGVSALVSVRDDLAQIKSVLQYYSTRADIVFTTGGISVGQKDLLEEAVYLTGAQVVFHGISMKPGMPTLFAVKNQTVILGLSGNPFSAAVPFELLIHPILAHMTQDPAFSLQYGEAHAANAFLKRNTCRRFLRAFCQNGVVSMPKEQANGQMRSMIGCNCFVDVPAGTEEIQAGDLLKIIWL